MTASEPRNDREAAIAALQEAAQRPVDVTDGSWEVVTEPLAAKTVFSVRLPMEVAGGMLEEAERLGKKPSTLAAELITEALRARHSSADQVVTVRLDDLHRAIDAAAHRSAA